MYSHPSCTGPGCIGCNPPTRRPTHVHDDYRPRLRGGVVWR